MKKDMLCDSQNSELHVCWSSDTYRVAQKIWHSILYALNYQILTSLQNIYYFTLRIRRKVV